MSEWIEWKGGECPVPRGTEGKVEFRDGTVLDLGNGLRWSHAGSNGDIVRYRVDDVSPSAGLNGGKLSGNHYYRVEVTEPMSPELQPYTAECADIIEALGMTFNEGEAFKALWRLAASRQGRGKPGNKAQYDADKVAHYGARVVACVKREVKA